MTTDEFIARLAAMSPTEKRAFKDSLDLPGDGDEFLVMCFVQSPSVQEAVCRMFGVKSQAQKVAEATISSARLGWIAIGLAGLSLTVTVISVIVGIVLHFWKP